MRHRNYFVYIAANGDPHTVLYMKNWGRKKKETLIDAANPQWRDLVDEMHAVGPTGGAR